MANKTIPELTEKLQLEPSDLLIVHGSGQTKKTNFYNALSLSAKNVTGSTKHISEWLSDVNDNTLKIVLLSANNTGIDTGVRALTSNWQSTYTNYTSNSSSYTTNSTVNSISSQLVLTSDFNNYKTNVASTTATLLPTSIYRSASGVWQSTYTTVRSNSAFWASNIDTGVRTLTGNWQNASTVVQTNSAFWASNIDTGVRALTGNWESTYTTVRSNSAQWASNVDTGVRALTGNWESTYTTVRSNSAQWASNIDTGVRALTGNWQSTYTTVQGNSAQWASNIDTGVRALTGNWESTYTTYSANSSTYIKTVATTTPGTSAVSTIVAVSALPASPDPNTLYIVI